MARVRFGSVVVGLRGTVGGLTFSANGASAYVKQWRRPVAKKTPLQQVPRAVVSGAGALWRALSDGQRSDWNAWAADAAQTLYDAFGDPYFATGWNWFVALQNWAATTGQSAPSDPPSAARPAQPTISSVSLDSTGTGSAVINFAAGEFENLWLVFAVSVATNTPAALPGVAQLRLFSSDQLAAGDDTVTISDLSVKLGFLQPDQSFTWRIFAQNDEVNRGVYAEGRGTIV